MHKFLVAYRVLAVLHLQQFTWKSVLSIEITEKTKTLSPQYMCMCVSVCVCPVYVCVCVCV